MANLSFSEVIGGLEQTGDEPGAMRGSAGDNWMQGRTMYGGLSAALCLEAAIRHGNKDGEDLAPLRSAMISFIGPAGAEFTTGAQTLRRGRSVATISADVFDEKGLATRGAFTFGAARPSMFDLSFSDGFDAPGPDEVEPFFGDGPGPNFSQNFEMLLAKGAMPMSGSDVVDHFVWVRHRDPKARGVVALLGLADTPPPAMLAMFPQPAPISSMTWMVNLLHDNPQTDDGWWLMRSRAEHAREGYSSQDMMIWNARGEAVVAGRQSVALFI